MTGTNSGDANGYTAFVTAPTAPDAVAFGAVALGAGVVAAGNGIAEAVDTCNSGKGSCAGSIVDVAFDTASIVPLFGIAHDVARTARTAADPDELVTGRHYTNDVGRQQIGQSGNLRSGAYVTKPAEIPAGTSSESVEKMLEIEPGKGSNYIDVQVPSPHLQVPENGPITSGERGNVSYAPRSKSETRSSCPDGPRDRAMR